MSAAEELNLGDQPVVTFGTLARAMGPIAPRALARILAGHKHKRPGPRRSYQAARRQAIDLFVHGTPLAPEGALRSYEREAIDAMRAMRLERPEWVRGVQPSPAWLPVEIGGVLVSMQPDVVLEGYLASGAAKFVFTKESLPRGVGSTMAALLYHHRRNVLGIKTTRPDKCMVYEPRLPWIHLPGPRPEAQIRSAELAARIIAALWPSL